MVLSFIFFSYISHSVAFLLVDNHSRVDLSSIRTSTTVLTSNNASLSVGSYEKESKRKIVNHLFTCSLFEYSKRQKKNRLSFSFFLSFSFHRVFFWHVRTMHACHDSRVMYSSVFVRSASLLVSVPREIRENDENKTAAAGVVKAYSSKTNSSWKKIYTHTHIDEHWVADCPECIENSHYFSITQYRHNRRLYIPLLSLFFFFLPYSLSLNKMTTTIVVWLLPSIITISTSFHQYCSFLLTPPWSLFISYGYK